MPDEVILGLSGGTMDSPAVLGFGGEVVERFSLGPSLMDGAQEIVRLRFGPGTDLAEKLSELEGLPAIRYAVPNEIIRQAETSTRLLDGSGKGPNDLHPDLWGLNNKENPGADISALEAWKVSIGSRETGPLVAVIDGGADYNHPDLRANIAVNSGEIPNDGIDNDGNGVVDDYFGYNAYDNNGDPLDRRGHGTHTAGTIAASGNNGTGVVGVNWKARLLPIKIFNDSGVTTVDAILRALAYARKRGAFITSNSWGGANFNPAIFDAFAATPGLHITAAGNDAQDIATSPAFPANFDLPNIVTVGATNRKDEPAVFSNYGRQSVELFAPGRDILSTMPGGEYGFKSGTSMACPHVTGVAALMKTVYPELSPQQIKDRLVFSSEPLESVSQLSISGGRLNAAQALSNDTIAPAAPNDFVVSEVSSRGARFSWTGTGDDGWKNGAAGGFEVRVSDSQINDESWDEAEPLPTPRGREIGTHHQAVFRQTPQREVRTLHAGLRVVDEAANRSELTTTEVVLPATPVIAEDNFDAPESEWRGEGRWQLVEHPDRGRVWSCQPAGSAGTFSRLTSPEFDLSGSRENFLRFESRQDFDWTNLVYVEVSTDGGEKWDKLDRLEDKGQWAKREYDLSPFDGQKVRFRVSSESLATKPGEGTVIDNFEILGEPTERVE